jgi:hypothetical protein
MTIGQRIWRIGQPPQRLREIELASEKSLEERLKTTFPRYDAA